MMIKLHSMVVTLVMVAAGAGISAEPELLFHATFDGSATAVRAKGDPVPLPGSRGLRYVPGRKGQALELKNGMTALLAYRAAGNLVPEQGTVAFWFRPDAVNFLGVGGDRRYFLCTPTPKRRAGSGALWFWKYGQSLRADQADDGDAHSQTFNPLVRDEWNHLVYTWGPQSTDIYLNGEPCTRGMLTSRQLAAAIHAKPGTGGLTFSRRQSYDRFFVGGFGGSQFMDGAMDDLRIWSAPLDAETVARMYREEGGKAREEGRPDYVAQFADDPPNPFEAPPVGDGGVPGELELVERTVFDRVPSDPSRYNAVGDWHVAELNGVKYLESSGRAHDRFAYRYALDTSVPLYVFEIDYPDDRKRTADFLVQGSRETRWDGTSEADYVLQEGVACGDEYPNTGRILTHRCLYWQRGADVSFMAMTARGEAPAAVSEIRVYKVKNGRLPVAAVNEPKANADGWRRTFALYFEDPAVGYDFGIDGVDARKVGPMIDRIAALMKYTGQNVLCYPGCWYDGLMDGSLYNPRVHAPAYREAYYAKFDREGLGFMPTMNWSDFLMPRGALTRKALDDGTAYGTAYTILDDGFVNQHGRHGQPANMNIAHPDVQRVVERALDQFICEGKDHPSFKGVVIHLTHHAMLWFSDIHAGYNDYCIDAFERAKGIRVPRAEGPRRGQAHADWIRRNCLAEWIDWRCDVVADFYRRLAGRLAAARPDLKLVVNTFLLPMWREPDYGSETFLQDEYRRAGLDARKLKDVKNLSMCLCIIPADYRWFGPFDPRNPRDNGRWGEHRARVENLHRNLYFKKGDYEILSDTLFPWVNQHDRYWESPIGRETAGKKGLSLSCDWLKECPWHVTTINPSGRHALRHYAYPLRHQDVLAMSKGGFLIGTYGTEDVLVPWMRAFRALPAVRMAEVGRVGEVVARQADFDGRSYFYVVNTSERSVSVDVAFPRGTIDLVSGVAFAGATALQLQPYELRSFSAPKGKPGL